MKMKTTLLAVAALTGATLSSTAQTTIYDVDFDTNGPNWGGATGPGENIATFSGNSAGVSGDAGNLSIDLTGLTTEDNSYGTGIFFQEDATGLATSSDLSDYVLTFDAMASGLSSSSSTFYLQLGFGETSATETIGSAVSISLSSSYQSYSINLSTITFASGLTLAQLNGEMQFKIYTSNAESTFGLDSDNSITFDNITITQVPEPSTYAALAGMMAIGAVMLRRRRS
jgi:hypothetical protein